MKTFMKTKKRDFKESLTLNDCQKYDVKICNITKEVVYHSSEFSPIPLEKIQKLVDKMIKLKMITLFGDELGVTEVRISIDSIDETDDLYIETFHTNPNLPVNELFDEYDRTMKYDDFLDSKI
jgi:hypothetical protein